ncbi:hypothetical protein COB52_03185 [Candidatus Kaiserbacteria bacterium]|nr:MAG: hypothetical protein COB52_03185 [Candidatus Kaiserbacteria bacterium]
MAGGKGLWEESFVSAALIAVLDTDAGYVGGWGLFFLVPFFHCGVHLVGGGGTAGVLTNTPPIVLLIKNRHINLLHTPRAHLRSQKRINTLFLRLMRQNSTITQILNT